MVMNIGMIGLSEGNGHPFSFSAIINGYSPEALREAGWDVICNYLEARDPSEFGFPGVQVTHAWTQSPSLTQSLSEACFIPHQVSEIEELIGKVDAVILARDDYEQHAKMALPLLKAGIPVFIDKPLSLDIHELALLKPYLESGQLMSCSAMRYARELDGLRKEIDSYGELLSLQGTVLNSWEKYGIHLLEAFQSVTPLQPISVQYSGTESVSSISIRLENGTLLQINSIERATKIFQLDCVGTKQHGTFHISDNFSMFRRALWHFIHSVQTHKPEIPANETLTLMRILIAGQISKKEDRRVQIDEIDI
ncbi:Gfo/Idh/MocA family protein [Caldalkalibacillus mannanilyticus]|uniref:Gfo/Idh/MocA family protein n=1 Tax=Caldalkalibacillus mannanilyticus TaxID=1418 RepID=UPI000469A4BF|nr:Gfo/Idh/MocA family oxidoreductase [Caldalkalibacillus mannanilyticus]